MQRFSYEYPRPAVTVDCVVLGEAEGRLQVLLVQRGDPPFVGAWALPGGYVNIDEVLDAAAKRELEEETGLTGVALEQLYTFGALDRHPTDRVITVAYFALVNPTDHAPRAASDAKKVAWFAVDALPELAFDHQHIVNVALERVRGIL
jgi:8-oxo-dGTP diphosphatase